jgi:hypothetical protein
LTAVPFLQEDNFILFQYVVSVLTFRQTAKVKDPTACFGRNPFGAVSAEFIPVIANKIVLDVEALENGHRLALVVEP